MYEDLKEKFHGCFGREAEHIFSAPGRTELGGNHTDHQQGRVLAAAVELDIRAAAAGNGGGSIRVMSEGYPLCCIELSSLAPRAEEAGTTAALIRGIAAGAAKAGKELKGFDAYVSSSLIPGGGLSSSAAFEVLMGCMLSFFSDLKLSPLQIARLGQYAENEYFGKPCGLMDQTACAYGGVVAIDFKDPAAPDIQRVYFDFASCGHALCIIDSGTNHARLTEQYAAIPQELSSVCRFFGKEKLREVDEAEFYMRLKEVRAYTGDRAALRAIHVFEENRRVEAQVKALRENDFGAFLALVRQSGRSSWTLLQNISPDGCADRQELAFTLAFAEKLLSGRGACRVHGGGFAGTAQAFVPLDMLDDFKTQLEAVLGQGCCKILSIRPHGGGIAI